jgi:hypothetical protein
LANVAGSLGARTLRWARARIDALRTQPATPFSSDEGRAVAEMS